MNAGRGFTLVELVGVLAIAAVLLTIAAPNFVQLLRAQQFKAAVNDVFGAIDLTRSLAIARGGQVMLAPAPDAADWAQGWTVFVDRDGDRRPGAGEEVFSHHGPLAAGMRIDTNFANGHGSPYIAYNAAGRSCSDTSSLAARWGTLTLTLGAQQRRITINMLGRARVCDPAGEGAGCAGSDPDP